MYTSSFYIYLFFPILYFALSTNFVLHLLSRTNDNVAHNATVKFLHYKRVAAVTCRAL